MKLAYSVAIFLTEKSVRITQHMPCILWTILLCPLMHNSQVRLYLQHWLSRQLIIINRVACVELAHSSLGDWKNIFITHLIIIIKSEVSTFPIVVIFFRGCVSEMVVLLYSVIYYIYIPGKLGLCFLFWCSVYGICKRSDTLWPVGRVRLFADYTISLSSLCRLIWRHWTNKMLVSYMLPSVCLRSRQFSQLSFIQYMGLCVFSLPISPVMIVRMCTLSYYHHQTGSMNH